MIINVIIDNYINPVLLNLQLELKGSKKILTTIHQNNLIYCFRYKFADHDVTRLCASIRMKIS